MPEHELSLPKDFSGEVRLFPLPRVVVFPGSVNPLRVFESRYREMFEDAIKSDRLLAMATLLPGYETEYYSRPPIAATVCIGQIAQHQHKDDGTYDILLIGLKRAQVHREITPVRSYRRANVQLLDQPEVKHPKLEREIGRRLLSRFENTLPERVSKMFENGEMTLTMLTDVIGHHVNADIDFKLKLLAEVDPTSRASMLIDLLSIGTTKRKELPPFSDN